MGGWGAATILWCNCRVDHIHKCVAKVDNYFSKVHDELLSCAGLPNELVTAAFLACRFGDTCRNDSTNKYLM